MNLEQIKINAILSADPEGIQIDGNHYKNDKIPIHKFLSENQIPFLEGNAMKYTFRHKRKNKQKDIAKAIHCLQLLLKDEYNMYMIGGELYTKEQYDEILNQSKNSSVRGVTETTVIYSDKGISINSEIEKRSNKNVYVAKLGEVKAVFIDLNDIDKIKQDVPDIGLTLVSHDRIGVTLETLVNSTIFVPEKNYIVLEPDGMYKTISMKAFEDVYERKL